MLTIPSCISSSYTTTPPSHFPAVQSVLPPPASNPTNSLTEHTQSHHSRELVECYTSCEVHQELSLPHSTSPAGHKSLSGGFVSAKTNSPHRTGNSPSAYNAVCQGKEQTEGGNERGRRTSAQHSIQIDGLLKLHPSFTVKHNTPQGAEAHQKLPHH